MILDVAHNPQAAKYLSSRINKVTQSGSGKVVALMAVLADKEVNSVVEALNDTVDDWHFAGLNVPRGQSANELELQLNKEIRESIQLKLSDTVSSALDKSLKA